MAGISLKTALIRGSLAAISLLALLKSPLFDSSDQVPVSDITPATSEARENPAEVVAVNPDQPTAASEISSVALEMADYLETADGQALLPPRQDQPVVSWEDYSDRHGFLQFEKELSPHFDDSVQAQAIKRLLVINRKSNGEIEEDPRQSEILSEQFNEDPIKSAEVIKKALAELPAESYFMERNYLIAMAEQLLTPK